VAFYFINILLSASKGDDLGCDLLLAWNQCILEHLRKPCLLQRWRFYWGLPTWKGKWSV